MVRGEDGESTQTMVRLRYRRSVIGMPPEVVDIEQSVDSHLLDWGSMACCVDARKLWALEPTPVKQAAPQAASSVADSADARIQTTAPTSVHAQPSCSDGSDSDSVTLCAPTSRPTRSCAATTSTTAAVVTASSHNTHDTTTDSLTGLWPAVLRKVFLPVGAYITCSALLRVSTFCAWLQYGVHTVRLCPRVLICCACRQATDLSVYLHTVAEFKWSYPHHVSSHEKQDGTLVGGSGPPRSR